VTVIEWLGSGRPGQIARIVICVELAVATGALVYLGGHLVGDVFAGSPPALPVHIEASCDGSASTPPCHVSITELYRGRYRLTTDVPATRLALELTPPAAVSQARALLLRVAQPGAVRVAMRCANLAGASIAPARVDGSGFRSVTSLPAASELTRLTFDADPGAGQVPFEIDEIGFFESDRGLLNDVRPLFAWIPATRFYPTLVPRAIARLFLFFVVASFVVPGGILRMLNPIVLGSICFTFCVLDLAILFSPYGSHDLRLFYAAGSLQEYAGTNLNIGPWQGLRLLEGRGLTFSAGAVPWSRMPGYGLFCALAGLMFGRTTILDLTMATVVLQVLFYSVALACFAWAAGLLFPPPAVFTVGLLIAFLPKQLGYTQVDAIIAPIALLVMASLCLRIKASRDGGPVRAGLDALVHLTFALWFLMRPDVLPGWLAVSLALHWRDWRRLLIPAAMFLAVGCSWGAYKMLYTREFALTTSSAGASLFCGLWEVPSRFALTCSDSSYFDWIRHHSSFNPQSKLANDFAVGEVLRFWLTFPGHFVVMIDHKAMECLGGRCWPGLRTYLHEALFYLLVWPPRAIAGLLTIIALAVAAGHERRRTLLFAWPLFFNAPLFWVMFASEGRFYSAIPIALLVAAVPPLFEAPFYARLAARPWRTVSVLAVAGIAAVAAWPFHHWLIGADAFHYWTPLLDPSKSALGGFK
jgi:hypothetical protein